MIINNLKDYVKRNKQGLFEILFDTSKLLMIGSFSSVSNSSTVYTSYQLNYKMHRIYKDAFELCLKTHACSQTFVNEAKVRNDIHNEIWTNTSTTQAYKEYLEQQFSSAYKEKNDVLYEWYHNYFTDKINKTIEPKEPTDFLEVDGKLVE